MGKSTAAKGEAGMATPATVLKTLDGQPTSTLIEQLVALENHDHRVLTVQLSLDTSTADGRHLGVQLHDALRPIKESLAPHSAERLLLAEAEHDAAGLLAHLPEGAKAIAAYLCEPNGARVLVPLPFSVTPIAHWDKRAWLGPLRDLANPRLWSLVIVADQRTARLFITGFSSIREIAQVTSGTPGKQATGGLAQSNISHRHDEMVRRHARRIVSALEVRTGAFNVGGICIAGPPEMIAALRTELPDGLGTLSVDYFHVDADASATEILERVRPVLEQRNQLNEDALVAGLQEAAGERRVAQSLARVIAAATASQIELLVAADRLEARGATCARCELILPMPHPPKCPICEGPVNEQPEFVEYLADRVTRQGGSFERVHGAAAVALAPTGIAARLRYPLPPSE